MHPDILRALAETRRADLHGPARVRRAVTTRQWERRLRRHRLRNRLDLWQTRLALTLRVGRRQRRFPEAWLQRHSEPGLPTKQLLGPRE
jgi:hypothetical protein